MPFLLKVFVQISFSAVPFFSSKHTFSIGFYEFFVQFNQNLIGKGKKLPSREIYFWESGKKILEVGSPETARWPH